MNLVNDVIFSSVFLANTVTNLRRKIFNAANLKLNMNKLLNWVQWLF